MSTFSADFSSLVSAIGRIGSALQHADAGGDSGLRAATETYADFIQDRYLTAGFGVGIWQPLTPKYLAQKERQGYPSNIGLRTFALYDSLAVGGPQNVFNVQDGEVEYGTSVPYATFFDARRPIFVEPDEPTMLKMLGSAAAGVANTVREFSTPL